MAVYRRIIDMNKNLAFYKLFALIALLLSFQLIACDDGDVKDLQTSGGQEIATVAVGGNPVSDLYWDTLCLSVTTDSEMWPSIAGQCRARGFNK